MKTREHEERSEEAKIIEARKLALLARRELLLSEIEVCEKNIAICIEKEKTMTDQDIREMQSTIDIECNTDGERSYRTPKYCPECGHKYYGKMPRNQDDRPYCPECLTMYL